MKSRVRTTTARPLSCSSRLKARCSAANDEISAGRLSAGRPAYLACHVTRRETENEAKAIDVVLRCLGRSARKRGRPNRTCFGAGLGAARELPTELVAMRRLPSRRVRNYEH